MLALAPVVRRFAVGSTWFALVLGLLVAACGGSVSVLHALGKPKGDGPARMDVKNSSGVVIERLFVAKTEAVDKARASGVEPGSEGDDALWGDDRLDNAGLREGSTFDGIALPDGRWDVLVVDHDNREQLVKGLRLRSGGKYQLEIGTAWAMAR